MTSGERRGTYDRRARAREDLTDVEAAWLAAVIDCEGSIIAVHLDRPTPSIRVVVYNTNRELMERVVELTGVGKLTLRQTREPHHKPCWYWQTYSGNARRVLRQTLPWLIEKREKATAALAN